MIPNSIEPVTLFASRAKLVPLELAHAGALLEAGRSLDIWPYLPTALNSQNATLDFVQNALAAQAQGTELPFAIIDQMSGKIVGSTRFLDISHAHRNLEIGWTWLSPEVWRTQINTECKYLLLTHAFEAFQMIRVQLKTDLRNVRSQKAIERLGAVKEGVLRHHRIMPDGYLRDSVYYSILADEWPAMKCNLEQKLQIL